MSAPFQPVAAIGRSAREQGAGSRSRRSRGRRRGREARQLSVVCTEDEQDLAKLHTKRETLAAIKEGNKEEIRASFGLAVGGVVEELGTWRSN